MEAVTRGKFALPIDQDQVARDWERRGYDCRVFVDGPGQEWNGFVHATNELVTVVEGALECTLEDPGAGGVSRQAHRLAPGDELFIPRHAVHSVRNIHPGTTRWLFGYD